MQRCCDVPIAHIPFIWPHIEGFVAKTLAYDECGRYWPADIFDLLLAGRSRLWTAYDSDRHAFDGFAVTDIIIWPRMTECRVWMIGGRHLRLWQDEMREMLEAFARDNGCSAITGSGRKGWTKMPGYLIKGVIIEKALSDGREK